MNDESTSPPGDDCKQKLAGIEERQAEFDMLWQQMSTGNTAGATRYRELRKILDDLRADYHRTCGELSEGSTLPPRILADWH